MASRSTYVRRIEQLESAVIGFGRGVARRRPGVPGAHHRAIEVAVDALVTSPCATEHDLVRIRLAQDVDFHVRHIDRLLDAPAATDGSRIGVIDALEALELALAALELRDPTGLARADRLIERILADAERPLMRDGEASAPDARLRRIALHVLAVAGIARMLGPRTRPRPTAVA